MRSRLEGAGASRCCAILALHNAGLAALERRCGLEPGLGGNGDGDGDADTEYGTPRTRFTPGSEYGSMQCAPEPCRAPDVWVFLLVRRAL